jgi:hypothetical protein
MANELAKLDVESIETPVEEKAPKKTGIARSMYAFLALAFAGLTSIFMTAPASADMSGFTLNLTWVGNTFASLFDAGTVVAPSFQGLVEAWFGPIIEVIVLVAIGSLILLIFVVGPAKAIEYAEKFLNKLM